MNATQTDADGYYERYITKGWSGTATPSMDKFTFTPDSYTYSNVQTNLPNQNYIGTRDALSITGHVKDASNTGIEGVDVTFDNGGSTVTTDLYGRYITSVAYGWNGTSTATKTGWTFTPSQLVYPVHLTTDLTGQDFVATDLTLGTHDINTLPTSFTVLPAFPNPFNPVTTITYGIDTDSRVTVNIYDITGQLITTLLNTEQTQGWHSIKWNGRNDDNKQVPAGIYLSKITSNNKTKTTKLMLLK